MRNAAISGIVFAVLLLALIFMYAALQKSCGELYSLADEIYENAKKEHWGRANAAAARLQRKWDSEAKWIAMLIDHSETDLIMQTIASMGEYVKYNEVPELMSEITKLKTLINHIPAKELPKLENIF